MPFRQILAKLGLDDRSTSTTPAAGSTASDSSEAVDPDTSNDSESPTTFSPSRRGTTRAPARGFASLRWSDGPSRVFGGLVNVSPDGCLIKTEAPLEEGTRVDLHLDIVGGPGDPPGVDAVGVVRHRTEIEGRRAYGVEFLDIDDDRTELLAVYRDALS